MSFKLFIYIYSNVYFIFLVKIEQLFELLLQKDVFAPVPVRFLFSYADFVPVFHMI